MKMKLPALIMAGGRGTRLASKVEKPLLLLKGKPLIAYVLEALKKSKHIARIIIVTSESTKKTESWAKKLGVETVTAPGAGYVEDLLFALRSLKLGKTLVVSADLPLLKSEEIDWAVEEYLKCGRSSAFIAVPLRVFEENKFTPTRLEEFVPSGLNFVDGNHLDEKDEAKIISENPSFALNVNTQEDLKRAEDIISR